VIRRRRRTGSTAVDLGTRVGEVRFANPIMVASGVAGHGTELASYVNMGELGAVVVKSLSSFEWKGNPAPRLHPVTAGMMNAVGLQGPGIERWKTEELPDLLATGAKVVVSIWGRSLDEYAEAAAMLAELPPQVVAVEVNLSCPNLKGKGMFAQSAELAAEAIAITSSCNRPRWAKLTAAVTDLVAIATSVRDAGAAAVTLVNTVPGLALNIETRKPQLGNGPGGLSGPAIHPVAVKAVWDVHAALPELPIVGVGGIATAEDAIELMLAGASAVQIGTAVFASPKVPGMILRDFATWCDQHHVTSVDQLVGAAHVRDDRS
jgi:dihydroorotate dehydrogenase (NAD+) catalytic subunit